MGFTMRPIVETLVGAALVSSTIASGCQSPRGSAIELAPLTNSDTLQNTRNVATSRAVLL